MVQRTQQQPTASEQMLKFVKLDKQYHHLFMYNNILDVSDLFDLTDETLSTIGILNNKHRKKILCHIETMKKQNPSPKYLVSEATFKTSPVNLLVWSPAPHSNYLRNSGANLHYFESFL